MLGGGLVRQHLPSVSTIFLGVIKLFRDTESACAGTGAHGVLQSQVPQQPQVGGFHYSAFNAAAQAPQMDALEMQLASMQGMPGYGEACCPISLCPHSRIHMSPKVSSSQDTSRSFKDTSQGTTALVTVRHEVHHVCIRQLTLREPE